MFTFPFFMLTYIPIALVALVKKASWKPIQHIHLGGRRRVLRGRGRSSLLEITPFIF